MVNLQDQHKRLNYILNVVNNKLNELDHFAIIDDWLKQLIKNHTITDSDYRFIKKELDFLVWVKKVKKEYGRTLRL
jgi:hypothetical protein